MTETVSGSGDQSLPALGAAAGDDLAAVGGGHTRTETVGAGAADLAGLVSAFHDDSKYLDPDDQGNQ